VAASAQDTILAGGLDATSVAAAIAAVRPWGVDASSGLETNGAKDPLKIAAFVSAAKGATCK
jgi:phosphoribosylanthranilate isomerase